MNYPNLNARLFTQLSFIAMLFASAVLFTAATSSQRNTTSTESNFAPLDMLLKDIQDEGGIQLQLVKNIDPLGIGVKNPATADNPQYLVINADMTFAMWDRSQRNEGRWNANGHQETMTFYCSAVNGRQIESNPAVYIFQVKSYSPQELVLVGTGRQGRVEMVYSPIQQYEQQAVQLSFNN